MLIDFTIIAQIITFIDNWDFIANAAFFLTNLFYAPFEGIEYVFMYTRLIIV